MSIKDIDLLSDIAKQAQADIQTQFASLDPIIGVRSGLRKTGYPVDVMTIDCLKSTRRITLLLHDDQPGQLAYQFGYIDKDPTDEFSYIAFSHVTAQQLCAWMSSHFLEQLD